MYYKKTLHVIGTINFAKESLSFKNVLLEVAYSILDIKLPCYNLLAYKLLLLLLGF